MPNLTLAFLFQDNEILLAMKKRGFGVGKWNGYGGKLQEGETTRDGIIREIKEESLVDVDLDSLKELGSLDFYFIDKEEWNQKVVIYRVDKFTGEPQETEEMSPRWFSFEDIPYGSMWAGDDEWLPYVISSQNFKGEIHFSDEGKKVIKCNVRN
jgi:ADP-ribose pyrophosphatase YjhB (NUDIX family)